MGPSKVTDQWEQLREQEPATAAMRCGVCRERDLRRGGRGRGDLIGWARLAIPGDEPAIILSFLQQTGRDQLSRRRGSEQSVIGRAGTGRYYLDPRRRPPQPGDTMLTTAEPRTSRGCRRGHQLSVDLREILEDVLRALARGEAVDKITVYLPNIGTPAR